MGIALSLDISANTRLIVVHLVRIILRKHTKDLEDVRVTFRAAEAVSGAIEEQNYVQISVGHRYH